MTTSHTAGGKAFMYKEHRRYHNKEGEEVTAPPAVEVMWQCPDPKSGPALVSVNFKLRGDTSWRKLRYSLKESAIR